MVTLQRAAISRGVRQRLGRFRESLRHLLGALEEELVAWEFHALGLQQGAAGLDAEQRVMSREVLMPQIVDIVGGDQRPADLARPAPRPAG